MEHQELFLQKKATKKSRAGRYLIYVIIAIAALFLLSLVWTGVAVGMSAVSVLDARDRLENAKSQIESFDFSAAADSVTQAKADIVKAEKYFSRAEWLSTLPLVGRQITASHELLIAAQDSFEIIERLVALGSDVSRLVSLSDDWQGQLADQVPVTLRYDQLTPDTKRLVLERINGASSDLALASAEAKTISLKLNELAIDENISEPLAAVTRKLRDQFESTTLALNFAATAARIIPEFTGVGEEKHFLLLLENNSEMRPAGGFIGTYGILRVKDGEISELEVKDSYLLDDAASESIVSAPPAPLQKYLSAEKWYFRDSNWSPDFPTSASAAIGLFTTEVLALTDAQRQELQTPLSFDGAIAFTPSFVSDLLRLTGPITIDGQTFTADNILDTLEYEVEKGFSEDGLPYAQRKDIITLLLNDLKAKVFSMPVGSLPAVLEIFMQNLSEKQLVLYSSDSQSDAFQAVMSADWGGWEHAPENTDYLLFADANLASLKSDPFVDRSISYSLHQSPNGRWVAVARVKYVHRGQFDWKTTRYRTYARLYVPAGSELIGTAGSLADDKIKNPSGSEYVTDVSQELGATVFGTFTSIEPGETRELVFEYYLPDNLAESIEEGTYKLQIEKQIGAANYPLTIDLDFGKKVASAAPAEASGQWNDDSYRAELLLDSDKSIVVGF